jgi:NRPS condensation-like uncharacterized protein
MMNTSSEIPPTLPVEFIERLLFAGGEGGFYRLNLGGVVAFEGRVDEARLARAMRLLLDAEPVLGCSFVAEAVPPYWKRVEDLDTRQLLAVREDDNPSGAAAAFVAEEVDAAQGPMARAALLRGPQSDTLALRLGHLAADGGALKEVLYLIGDIYRALSADPEWEPLPNLDGVRKPVTKVGLAERLRIMGVNDAKLLPSDPGWYVPLLGGHGRAAYASASVEPGTFRAATALARQTGATVNDMILTALYRTLWPSFDSAPGSLTPLMITSDLRKHLPPGTKTAISNISGTWSVSVSPAADEGFGGTLARVARATQAWKRTGAGKATAMGIPMMDKLTRKSGLGLARKMMSGMAGKGEPTKGATVVTNIGVVDATRLDFGTAAYVADAWLLAPVSPMGIAFCASTYRDHLVLSAGVDLAATDERLVRGIVEGVAEAIGSWVVSSARTQG